MKEEKKYKALRLYISFLIAIGILLMIFAAVLFVRIISGNSEAYFLGTSLGLVISGFMLFAIAQLVVVIIDIENNTRRVVTLLEKNNQ